MRRGVKGEQLSKERGGSIYSFGGQTLTNYPIFLRKKRKKKTLKSEKSGRRWYHERTIKSSEKGRYCYQIKGNHGGEKTADC